MKWMTPDERNEWHATLDDANAHPGTTGERAEKLLSILAEMTLNGRYGWIDEALKHLALHGAQRELKRRLKIASTVLVPFDAVTAIKSMRVGARSQRGDGSSGFQQKLFEEMSCSVDRGVRPAPVDVRDALPRRRAPGPPHRLRLALLARRLLRRSDQPGAAVPIRREVTS